MCLHPVLLFQLSEMMAQWCRELGHRVMCGFLRYLHLSRVTTRPDHARLTRKQLVGD